MATDIRELLDALEAAERDAETLVAGLSEEQGVERLSPGSWSVAECLDHLATGNRVYLQAMEEPVKRARERGRLRRRPARPSGLVARLFLAQLEPPPKWWSRLKAPGKIQPAPSPPLAESFASFMDSHARVRAFVRANADLDLASIRFQNPFVSVLYFTLATGLYVLETHARRHLQQAWGVRRALKGAEG